jgi:tRNA (adenine57-N1/adenine58-N1)-methyltransferase catalytic subunit
MPSRGPLRPGDSILFIDRKQRRYLRTLKPGATIRVRDGKVDCDRLIGLPDGSRVTTSANDAFLVLRPSYAELVLNLPRQAQADSPHKGADLEIPSSVRPMV